MWTEENTRVCVASVWGRETGMPVRSWGTCGRAGLGATGWEAT